MGTKSRHLEHTKEEASPKKGRAKKAPKVKSDKADIATLSEEETRSDEISLEEPQDPFCLNAKERERNELQRQIDEFISKGGTIQKIDPSVSADPPKKPTSNYGSRPI